MQKENPVNPETIRKVFGIVKDATKTVKIFPFAYAFLLLLILPIATFGDYDTAQWIGALFYESILFMALFIRLSYIFKLCKWHRLQCILPLLPQIIEQIDANIYEFGCGVMTLNYTVYSAILILSLVNAYKVFIVPAKIPSKHFAV